MGREFDLEDVFYGLIKTLLDADREIPFHMHIPGEHKPDDFTVHVGKRAFRIAYYVNERATKIGSRKKVVTTGFEVQEVTESQ